MNVVTSKYDKILTDNDKLNIINDYKINMFSIRDLASKYNIKNKTYIRKLLGDNTRKFDDGIRLSKIKHKGCFKQSEETKSKLREIRLNYMKLHPENTAWRKSNISYPEKLFINIIKEYHLDEKFLIVREYSFFPYFIDFAFVDLKVAVEIDGSQHLKPERKEKDNLKDELLISNGWRVIRISENEVKYNKDNVIKQLNNFINCNTISDKVGVIKMPKKYLKKERKNGKLTDKEIERAFKQRKCERPSKENLFSLLKQYSFNEVSKFFKVSDRTIRKWCKYYDLPSNKKELMRM